ncbi:hypothetical protein THARTR1_10265 [Trichoderma harzianum]|uniref:Uncharacterized protein n=1 Tax=Trichoderma harzianum TaxID=5544 RepID=A0A2K0TTG8_TRIHA|nr:hypothetical protein THARTR1_10265 [Trichoderma harzianum]
MLIHVLHHTRHDPALSQPSITAQAESTKQMLTGEQASRNGMPSETVDVAYVDEAQDLASNIQKLITHASSGRLTEIGTADLSHIPKQG